MSAQKEQSTQQEKSRPAPLETDPGEQQDDNLDDLGRRTDGTEQDQPLDSEGEAASEQSGRR